MGLSAESNCRNRYISTAYSSVNIFINIVILTDNRIAIYTLLVKGVHDLNISNFGNDRTDYLPLVMFVEYDPNILNPADKRKICYL